MPSYVKRGSSWRVFIRRKGITKPITGTFPTKTQAEAWAARQMVEIEDHRAGRIPDHTFGTLLGKYCDEVSVHKRGERWERLRICLLQRDEIAQVRLRDLSATHVAAWRDRRLQAVSGASVRREWTLMSHACTIAIREWQWLRLNPFKDVRRPPPPEPRDKLYTDEQIEQLRIGLGEDPATATGRTMLAFLFAVETAMRAGEICGLTWERVDMVRRVARLVRTKNGGARDVALSPEALRLLALLARDDTQPVFQITVHQLDALFRKGKKRAMIADMTFHDSRHLAITRLSKKLDVRALARMVGHRDLNQLMVYYNESAADIATRL